MFEFLVTLFDALLYRPLFNALILIYEYFPPQDFGLAIIWLTIFIRLIIYPISVKAVKSQKTLQRLQPQIQELQKKYKNDKEKQAKETLELYQKEKINPFSGLLLVIVQLPILIALYRVFYLGLKPEELSHLYSFVVNPGHINAMFLGLLDLSKANLILAIIAGVSQFVQTKMLLPKLSRSQAKTTDVSTLMQKQMAYVFPFITVLILYKLPAAIGLYWIISGIFSIVQQYYILKKIPS